MAYGPAMAMGGFSSAISDLLKARAQQPLIEQQYRGQEQQQRGQEMQQTLQSMMAPWQLRHQQLQAVSEAYKMQRMQEGFQAMMMAGRDPQAKIEVMNQYPELFPHAGDYMKSQMPVPLRGEAGAMVPNAE